MAENCTTNSGIFKTYRYTGTQVFQRPGAENVHECNGWTGRVEYVEPNGTKEAFLTPNDQYAPQQMNAPDAGDTTQGSSVKIGIVDQGVKYDHD